MAFQHKEGQFSLFKNDRKEKPEHPDYSGTGCINGKEHRISAWIKDGQRGKFFSISIKERVDAPKREQSSSPSSPTPNKPKPVEDDDIPFRSNKWTFNHMRLA